MTPKTTGFSLSIVLSGLLALVLAGCVTGAKSETPVSEFLAEWTPDNQEGVEATTVPDSVWWARFGNPELQKLIQKAVSENPSLEAARSRARAARFLVGTAESRLRPQLQASTGYTRVDLSENLPILDSFITQGLVEPKQELFSASFDAGWELDVFGGARHQVDAAAARAKASKASLEDAHRSLVAEVAKNYFELKNRQRQAELLHQQQELLNSMAEWSRTRLRTGVGTETAVAEAETRLLSLQAHLPSIQAGILASHVRLAILCGSVPEKFDVEMNAEIGLPDPPDPLPVGLPGDLLRRRPDIRRAEYALAAAEAKLGAQTANQFPKFFISASVTQQAQNFTELTDSKSSGWLIAPLIQWNFYQGGAVRAEIKAGREERDAAYLTFQQTIMRAVGEVETRLQSYNAAFETRQEMEAAGAQVRRAVRVAESAYDSGVVSEGAVFKAKLALAEMNSRLVQAQTDVLITLVALNKALGGGWSLHEKDES